MSFWLNQCNRYHNLSVRNLSSPNLGSQFGHSVQPNGTFIDPLPTQLPLDNLSSETLPISSRKEKGNSFRSFVKANFRPGKDAFIAVMQESQDDRVDTEKEMQALLFCRKVTFCSCIFSSINQVQSFKKQKGPKPVPCPRPSSHVKQSDSYSGVLVLSPLNSGSEASWNLFQRFIVSRALFQKLPFLS